MQAVPPAPNGRKVAITGVDDGKRCSRARVVVHGPAQFNSVWRNP